MAFYEIEHVRTLRRGARRRGDWEGTRSFLSSQNEAPSLALSLIDTLFPDTPGSQPAVCTSTDIKFHPNGVAGVALVLAHYSSRLEFGQINVSYRTSPQGNIKLLVDRDGNIITGPTAYSTAHAPSEWHIVAGTNAIPDIAVDIQVQASIFWRNWRPWKIDEVVGTINKNSMSIRGSRYPTGTLRLNSYQASDPHARHYINTTFFFSVNRNGWNNDLLERRGEMAVQQIETKDTSGAPTGEVRDVLFFDPQVGDIESRRLYELDRWSPLPWTNRW